MKSLKYTIKLAAIILLFTACNSREKDEKAADIKLAHIQELISENKLNEAKSEIDSIHLKYPNLVDKRKLAVILNDSITLRESYRTLKYAEKVIPQLKKSLEELKNEFIFQKNEKYEEFGKYTYKTQKAELNDGRTYLKCEFDENNDFYLTSQYCGARLNEYAIKVEASGLSLNTDLNNKSLGTFHSFEIENKTIEQLTFKNDDDGGLAQFIKENELSDIKITLIGNKEFSYILNSKDKEAISKTITFAKATKLLAKTEKDVVIAQQKIGKINLLYKD